MDDARLQALQSRLQALEAQHHALAHDLEAVRADIRSLETGEAPTTAPEPQEPPPPVPPRPKPPAKQPKPKLSQAQLEAFIGGNLIAKLGIVVLVVGVGFFIRYAIENDLISPVMRILAGYLAGLLLTGLAWYLRQRYRTYSAVLLAGGLAVLYFTTFAAYDFYQLLPQLPAFMLMCLLTLFGVVAAYFYDLEVIGIFGLAGAYAVPLLVSSDTGNANALFAYTALINLGVLWLSWRKPWQWLPGVAVFLTWALFAYWYGEFFDPKTDVATAIGFLSLFFVQLYPVLVLRTLLRPAEKAAWPFWILLLAHSNYAYITGLILLGQTGLSAWQGLFSLGNALVHFGFAVLAFRQKLADRRLFFLLAGLTLALLIITIPLQLDGQWVTLIWMAGATLLFWVGRTQQTYFYERASHFLLPLAIFSLWHDFSETYASYIRDEAATTVLPLWNLAALTAVLVIGALAFLNLLRVRHEPLEGKGRWASFSLPLWLVLAGFTFVLAEGNHFTYFQQAQTLVSGEEGERFYDPAWRQFRPLLLASLGLLFGAGLAGAYLRWPHSRRAGFFVAIFLLVGLVVWFQHGGEALWVLVGDQINPSEPLFPPGAGHRWAHYLSWLPVGLALWLGYRAFQRAKPEEGLAKLSLLLMHFGLLAALTLELQLQARLWGGAAGEAAALERAREVGFSVLWGIYALGLVAWGLIKKQQMGRFAGIGLLAVVLIKVFLFDLSGVSIANKTIIFLALGALLLLVAFLYQRFKAEFEATEEPKEDDSPS